MVVVGMVGQDDFDVGEFETEFFDAGADERDGAVETRVDEDVTLGRGDEVTGQTGRADVLEIVGNPVGREWCVPVVLREEWQGEEGEQSNEHR